MSTEQASITGWHNEGLCIEWAIFILSLSILLPLSLPLDNQMIVFFMVQFPNGEDYLSSYPNQHSV